MARNSDFSNLLIVLLIFASVLTFCACSGEDRSKEGSAGTDEVVAGKSENGRVFRSVSGKEAYSLIMSKKDLSLIDVRTPQERQHMRIAGSLLVPVGDVMRGRLMLPKKKPVMLLCAVGGRSYVAAKVLSKTGHIEVYNLEGGVEAWRRAGLPVEYGPEPTDKAVVGKKTGQ